MFQVDKVEHAHGIDGSLNGPWYAAVVTEDRDTVCLIPARRREDMVVAKDRAARIAKILNDVGFEN